MSDASGNVTMAAAALGGLLAVLLIVVGMWSLIGFILACIWQYAILAVWPALPMILWWQFSLMAVGLAIVGKLIAGPSVKT